jgi:hypothetical protein
MKRILGIVVASALLVSHVRAQTMEQLPSGVLLRINTPGETYTGVLASQSADSVRLTGRRLGGGGQAVATPAIRSVERSEPAYARSMLVDGLIGLGVGSAVYFSNAQKDRGIVFGSGISIGAVVGLLYPSMRWVAVSLR